MAESFATNKGSWSYNLSRPCEPSPVLTLSPLTASIEEDSAASLAGSDGTYTAPRHRIRAIESLPLGKISRKYLGEVLIWQVLESIQRCRVLGECNGKLALKYALMLLQGLTATCLSGRIRLGERSLNRDKCA